MFENNTNWENLKKYEKYDKNIKLQNKVKINYFFKLFTLFFDKMN